MVKVHKQQSAARHCVHCDLKVQTMAKLTNIGPRLCMENTKEHALIRFTLTSIRYEYAHINYTSNIPHESNFI